MNQSDFERLLELTQRRALAPLEQSELDAWLTAHPEAQTAWAEETALNRILAALPDAPLSPQFTSQVLARVERLDPPRRRSGPGLGSAWLRPLLTGWRGAVAGTAVLAVTLAVSVSRHHQAQARTRLAESVAAMSALAELPSIEALAEFEVVYHLPTGPLPDVQELAQAFE